MLVPQKPNSETIKMFKVPEPKTKNRHETTWDGHGSYQWTYFADEVKQRIKFFLQERLHGKNLEVGGGWYLSYPNSTVIDLSSVCLDHNPAKDKVQFDLDTIGEGERLPFPDDSFDSATIISAWQYLRHPKAVLGELERVLMPGAEMYVINGQGSGLSECKVGISTTPDLQRFFQEMGYDTLIEHVPPPSGRVSEFQSLCVPMPEFGLFKLPSQVRNKAQKVERDKELCRDPSTFENEYVDWEIRNMTARFEKLSTFPVTRYSQEYFKRVEAFSQDYHKQTGGIPLIFARHGFEPELAMMLPDEITLFSSSLFLIGENEPVDKGCKGPVEGILEKHGLGFSRYINYFDYPTTKALLKNCDQFGSKKGYYGNPLPVDPREFIEFIGSLGLNSFTRQLQAQVYKRLKPNLPVLDSMVYRERAFGYYMAAHEAEQERSIDKLVEAKRRIASEGIPVVETRELEFDSMLPGIRECIKRSN